MESCHGLSLLWWETDSAGSKVLNETSLVAQTAEESADVSLWGHPVAMPPQLQLAPAAVSSSSRKLHALTICRPFTQIETFRLSCPTEMKLKYGDATYPTHGLQLTRCSSWVLQRVLGSSVALECIVEATEDRADVGILPVRTYLAYVW